MIHPPRQQSPRKVRPVWMAQAHVTIRHNNMLVTWASTTGGREYSRRAYGLNSATFIHWQWGNNYAVRERITRFEAQRRRSP